MKGRVQSCPVMVPKYEKDRRIRVIWPVLARSTEEHSERIRGRKLFSLVQGYRCPDSAAAASAVAAAVVRGVAAAAAMMENLLADLHIYNP